MSLKEEVMRFVVEWCYLGQKAVDLAKPLTKSARKVSFTLESHPRVQIILHRNSAHETFLTFTSPPTNKDLESTVVAL